MQTFDVEIKVNVLVELDEEVIDRVDDKWRSQLYDLETPEAIAGHIAYNLAINRVTLSQMDGWADLPNDKAKIVDEDAWITSCREVT